MRLDGRRAMTVYVISNHYTAAQRLTLHEDLPWGEASYVTSPAALRRAADKAARAKPPEALRVVMIEPTDLVPDDMVVALVDAKITPEALTL